MKEICSYDGCEKTVYARGFCSSHYGKFMRNGTPDGSPVFQKKQCKIENCNDIATRKGMCGRHYKRMMKFGDPEAPVRQTAKRGEPYKFMCEEIKKETDECLLWPYAKIPNGYGVINHEKNYQLTHRLVCMMVHGEPPFPEAQAAHLCGNGHLGCFNPRHLKWTDQSENQMHRVKHGTSNRGESHGLSHRTNEQILQLKSYIDKGMTDTEIGKMVGEHPRYVNMIRHGKIWSWLTGYEKKEKN